MKPSDALPHPADWSVTTVRDSVELRRGVSWSKDQEQTEPRPDTVPVLGIKNVQEELDTTDLVHLSGVPSRAKELKKASKGWSIIVGSNGNRNRIGNAVYQAADADYLIASFLLAARPRPSSGIRSDYFFRWLTTYETQARLSASAEGSTGLSNLSHAFFKSMEIPFPQDREQEFIVDILNRTDSILGHARTISRLGEKLKRQVIRQSLHTGVRKGPISRRRCGDIPSHWGCGQLRDFIEEGPTNGLYRPDSDYGNDGIPIVRIDSFDDGVLHSINTLYRVRLAPIEAKRYGLLARDILINRVNSLSHIGKATIVPALAEETVFESNIMRVRLKDGLIPEFLNIVLSSDIAKRHWLSRAKPAVNQASINQRDVRDLWLPLPEPSEQETIVRLVETVQRRVFSAGLVIAAYNDLKRGLRQGLLKGAIRAHEAFAQSAVRV